MVLSQKIILCVQKINRNKRIVMQTLFFTLIAFVAIILLMSIGFIIKKQSLKGSCGGLSTLGIAKACDCDKPCDTLQSKIRCGR